MPPIPIFSDSPIVGKKPDGVTPQTQEQPTPTYTAATTTSASSPSTYPAAQPGATAGPAPTASISRPQPPPPTRTAAQTTSQDGPPAPQPGAVATPRPAATSTASSGPAAPQPGSNPASASTTTQPPQFSIPPPQSSNLATHSTSTTTTPSRTGPTILPLGAVPQPPSETSQYSTSQPAATGGGYQQDPYAAEMTAQQRASLENLEASERTNSISSLVSGLTGDKSTPSGGEGVWSAVKGFAAAAGNKAVELEEEVWKRVNGK